MRQPATTTKQGTAAQPPKPRWTVNGALNPLIQIFKPVSPLAWLPIVTMVVSALYLDPLDWLPKSLVISAITVFSDFFVSHRLGSRMMRWASAGWMNRLTSSGTT